ncbi:MAG: M14 family metallopeptidase [Alphaproteobacteria bacterium]|nr:M14 family metallopeptidase [Alphaproteobacteria bacterium]
MIGVCTRFARDYATARRKFLLAAELAGKSVRTYAHPMAGPSGEAMANDVVLLGDPDATRVLVITSGTHGPELFCGSGAQIDAMLDLAVEDLGDVALLLCHAVNPYGAAWLRRGNEDNIDINRNHADFTRPLPDNQGYAELHDAFIPAESSDAAFKAAEVRIRAYAARNGEAALRIATSGGQYTHPDGMFYGGTAPSWSRRTMEAILDDFRLRERDFVACIDFHTGAGPFGYCEPIYSGDIEHPGCARLQRWIGPAMTLQRTGKSATPPQVGLSSELWEKACGRHAAYVSFEYGTIPNADVIDALRAEHVLHRQGRNDWHDGEVQRVKRRFLDAFAPDSREWREMVIQQARMHIRRVARGLATEKR